MPAPTSPSNPDEQPSVNDTLQGIASRRGVTFQAMQEAYEAGAKAERARWTELLTEKWHAGDGQGQSLQQYLGMTAEEYARWVVNG